MAGESDPNEPDQGRKSLLDKALNLFAETKAGEGINVVLMFLNVFLIMSAYYIMKVVREALALAGIDVFGIKEAEIKAYLPAVMGLLMIGIVPAYAWLSTKVPRLKLITITTLILFGSLCTFWLWGRVVGISTAIGLTFFIWLGIVNVFLIAQFWSYANDIYTETQGKRLFAIIAIGQSLGAILGPIVAGWGAEHTFLLLFLAGVLLLVCLFLYRVVNAREARLDHLENEAKKADTPLGKDGAFALVFQTKYLLLIALMILVTNLVNTTGEYILSDAAVTRAKQDEPVAKILGPDADARVKASPKGEDVLSEDEQKRLSKARGAVIGKFYGTFFGVVNLVGLLIQMFLVSRVFKYLGVRAALVIMPVISFGGYMAIGLIGGLLVIRIAKTAENSTDYSLQNTLKQVLFLPTSREAKYKAKAVIDMFFVRIGDAASAGLVALGLHVLAFGSTQFAFVNVGLAVIWIIISLAIGREHQRLHADKAELPKATAKSAKAKK